MFVWLTINFVAVAVILFVAGGALYTYSSGWTISMVILNVLLLLNALAMVGWALYRRHGWLSDPHVPGPTI